ncbi:MAG: molybdopterin molybdotransferase MoeA [Methanomicrobiales archaeon]|nr:molybdopterin molybdotransferase MoeA [Methanomicrobiales archaeon]
MSRFLSVVPVDTARSVLCSLAKLTKTEHVSLLESSCRILRTDVTTDIDIPGFNRSTVDGYAVHSSDTTGASESIPAMLKLAGKIAMGDEPSSFLNTGSCMYIPTGAFLPSGADAVVMVEMSEELGDEILILKPVGTGENVVHKGEDFSTDHPAVYAGVKITSREMGVLAACGFNKVMVSTRPKIAIISTGNEVIPISHNPQAGQIRDVNTYLCAGFVSECGAVPIICGIIRDEQEALEMAISDAVSQADVVLISGGSSKGERDMCADIIAEKGELLVHGIALSPGKPTIIGKVKDIPVIGLPGHPTSAYVVLKALVRDLIRVMTGEKSAPVSFSGILSSPVPSAKGREDYIRVKYENDIITPVFGKSGLTNTLVNSNGLLCIPAEIEGYEKNSRVIIQPW